MPLPSDRLDRVENLRVNGTPDINFCGNGVECWIEQKHPTEPKRKGTPLFGSNHPVSQDQMNWFLRQNKAGGRCFFLITSNKRWMLIPGTYADDLNGMTVEQLMDVAIWATMKPIRDKDAWRVLREMLIR